jgi:hypothetical protein
MMVIDNLLRTGLHLAISSLRIVLLSPVIVSQQYTFLLGIMLDYSRENVQPATMVRTRTIGMKVPLCFHHREI